MGKNRVTILIVDDEELIRRGVARKMQAEGYDCVVAGDGEQALQSVSTNNIDLMLLDIKMPGMSGLEVLSHMTANHPDVAVVMLTATADTQTAVQAMRMGAYDYLTKPFDLNDLSVRIEKVAEKRRLLLENREYQLHLQQMVEQQVEQVQKYYEETIQALAREGMALERLALMSSVGEKTDPDKVCLQLASTLTTMIEIREPYLSGHIEKVSELTIEIARELCCSESQIKDIRLAAAVYEIGRVAVPEYILLKPGQLTPEEYIELQKHPQAAVDIIRRIDNFKGALNVIKSQRERYNGEGYPNKLKGDDIPLGARILAVADAFHAMTSPRPYRPPYSISEAVQILKDGAGGQWGPEIVDAFFYVLERNGSILIPHARE